MLEAIWAGEMVEKLTENEANIFTEMSTPKAKEKMISSFASDHLNLGVI